MTKIDKTELARLNMDRDFVPIILGSDTNVYGVASSFHQAYGMDSIALAKTHQIYTNNLPFLKVHAFDNFDKTEVFVESLNNFAKRDEVKGKKLLLIPCSDYYAALVIQTKEKLDKAYLINVIDEDLRIKLENKKDFYETCDTYGFKYPKTFLISQDNYTNFELPFEFPVIAKPNDSIKYYNVSFEGYKKAYKVESKEELLEILNKVYSSGYDDYFIIQDFIPGSFDAMYVVNAYCDKQGKVVMTSAARCALDECLPNDIGNYNALITGDYPVLTDAVKEFLENINYHGFANFDFKFDSRSNTFNVFEMNLRQGRSSYYMTVAGNNFVTYMVNDMIKDEDQTYYNHVKEHLWYYTAKSVLKKHCPDLLSEKINELFRKQEATFSLSYFSNRNLARFLLCLRRKISTIKYYPIYFKKED